MDKFTVQEIERVIEFEPESDDYSETYDEGEPVATDLRGALDALRSNVWDYIDARADGTIILYPADMTQDYRTGEWNQTQVIVKAARPEWADRLLALYEARS